MKLKLILFALVTLILSGFAYQNYDQIITRVLIVQNRAEIRTNAVISVPSTGATATPGLIINQAGAGKVVEYQDSGTPVWSVLNGGAVRGQVVAFPTPGLQANCKTNTITDTASYTATVTAISTPIYTWCSMDAITGDAEKCAATFGQTANITISVKNSNATPAANAAGAAVTWCVLGTP